MNDAELKRLEEKFSIAKGARQNVEHVKVDLNLLMTNGTVSKVLNDLAGHFKTMRSEDLQSAIAAAMQLKLEKVSAAFEKL